MDISKAFSDPTLEEDGVWVDYREGSQIKIARVGNKRFQKFYDLKMKPHRRAERAGKLSALLHTEILCECLAETVLLGWKGFTNGTAEFKYSKTNALELLKQSMDFRDEVTAYATDEEAFKQEDEEDASKN